MSAGRTISILGLSLTSVLLCTNVARAQLLYKDYDRVKTEITKGTFDSNHVRKLDGWIRNDMHGKKVGEAPFLVPMCLNQLKLLVIKHSQIAPGDEPATWVESAREYLEKTEGDQRCNELIYGKNNGQLSALRTQVTEAWQTYRTELKNERLASLVAICRRIEEVQERFPLQQACQADDYDVFRQELVDHARSVRRALIDKWKGTQIEAPPEIDTADIGAFYDALRTWMAKEEQQRQALWVASSSNLKTALRGLPEQERRDWESKSPGDPKDDKNWDFWAKLDSLDILVSQVKSASGAFQKDLETWRARHNKAASKDGFCEGLNSICGESWASSNCTGTTIRSVLADCQSARARITSTSSLAEIKTATMAKESLASADWSNLALQLRDVLRGDAQAARSACANRAKLLTAMNRAVSALDNASVEQPNPYFRAGTEIRKCSGGPAGDYSELVAKMRQALTEIRGSGESDCGGDMGGRIQRLTEVAGRIRNRGADEAKPDLLVESRAELARALKCQLGAWQQEFSRVDDSRSGRRVDIEEALQWLDDTEDPEYATVRTRLEEARPPEQDRVCVVTDATIEQDPEAAVNPWLTCKPSPPPEEGVDACPPLVVAVAARTGLDLARSDFNSAASQGRLRRVKESCPDLNPEHRELLDYLIGYVAWKSGAAPDMAQLRGLGLDPDFDSLRE